MDDAGRLAVTDEMTGDTLEVVEFVDETVRDHVKTLSPGSRVRLSLERVGRLGEKRRRIVRVLPSTVPHAFGAD